jgi:hypothetical protein
MRYLFDKIWFEDNQKTLIFLLNNYFTRRIFRKCLWLGKKDCPLKTKINRIEPNAFWFGGKKVGDKIEISVDFRTHNKFSKRLYFAFLPIWYLYHYWDIFIANNFKPAWNLGFDTLTVYPDASTGGTTCDGVVGRISVDQTFANIRAGAGNTYDATLQTVYVALYATATTNQFDSLYRSIMTFNTAALTSSATISQVVAGCYGQTKYNGLGKDTLHYCASTPAANNALANSDYGQLGSVSFGSVAYDDWSTVGYNSITLDANGIANVSKTGISRFGARGGWDITGTFGGVWKSGDNSDIDFYSSDYTGTTRDPKLVITYTLPAVAGNIFMGINI